MGAAARWAAGCVALHLVWRVRAHVWMKFRVLAEQGVLMMHSFSLRDFLSWGESIMLCKNSVEIAGAGLHERAVDDGVAVNGLRQSELRKVKTK